MTCIPDETGTPGTSKLAGIPNAVLSAAKHKLAELEAGSPASAGAPPPAQPDLFSSPAPHPLLAELEQLDIDDLSPRQALETLYRLRSRLD